MNGYLRIKNTDLYEHDGVMYWRNGGNIIGNVVKAVIEEDDVVTETYYIESLKTAKPIMLDPDVKIGGLTSTESKNGNFIIVVTESADFSEYGGGAGLKITFIYGMNYYSIETVESNGDIKIYDPDGDAGTLIPDALPDTADASAGDALVLDEDKKPVWRTKPTPETKKYYLHSCGGSTTFSGVSVLLSFDFVDSNPGPYSTAQQVADALNALGYTSNSRCKIVAGMESVSNKLRFVRGVYGAGTPTKSLYCTWLEFASDASGNLTQSNFGSNQAVTLSASITTEL